MLVLAQRLVRFFKIPLKQSPKIGDSQAFPPLKKAILQGKGPVAEVREDYSLKAREDSVTVNFNSVTNPAMEVVTTAMKK